MKLDWIYTSMSAPITKLWGSWWMKGGVQVGVGVTVVDDGEKSSQ
jgi:hypothetical protein